MNEVLVIEQIFGWLTRQSDRVGSTISSMTRFKVSLAFIG